MRMGITVVMNHLGMLMMKMNEIKVNRTNYNTFIIKGGVLELEVNMSCPSDEQVRWVTQWMDRLEDITPVMIEFIVNNFYMFEENKRD